MYVSGSADLHGSNKNYIDGGGDFGVNLGKRWVRPCAFAIQVDMRALFISEASSAASMLETADVRWGCALIVSCV